MRVSVGDPGFDAEVNVRRHAQVLEAARATGARVVFSSTGGAIYGEVETIPSPESTPCAAMAPYGISKLCGEDYVELSNRLYGTNHVVLRYGNVYGPRQDPHGEAGVVAIFFGKLARGRDAARSSATASRRATTSTSATSSGPTWRRSATRGPEGSFNIGTGTETSVLELLAACQHAAGTAVSPEHRAGRVSASSREARSTAAGPSGSWAGAAEVGFGEGLAATLAEIGPEPGAPAGCPSDP